MFIKRERNNCFIKNAPKIWNKIKTPQEITRTLSIFVDGIMAFSIITQVIIEILALSLAENGIIFS